MGQGLISFSDRGRSNTLPVRFWNMYMEPTPEGPTQNRRYGRPALNDSFTVGDGPIRATFIWQGARISVSGGEVYSNSTKLGDVSALGDCRFAISEEECVVITNDTPYLVSISGLSVTEIVDVDLPSARDVVQIAGRFVYVIADDSGMYAWSGVNDAATIDGLAFASAESSPDPITGAIVSGDNVMFIGTRSTEWHYPTESIDAPFQRSRGRRYEKGTTAINSIVLVDNAVYFLGQDKIVYRAGAVPQRVSDHDLEDRLRPLTGAELAAVRFYYMVHAGHTWLAVDIDGVGTWVLDVAYKNWMRWTSYDGEGFSDNFRIQCSDGVDGSVLGDKNSGTLFQMATGQHYDNNTDPIQRICGVYVPLTAGTARNSNVVLHCSRGVGNVDAPDPIVYMRFSDQEGLEDTFSEWLPGTLGAAGDRTKAAMAHWVGLGSFGSPGRLYEFRCEEPVFFSPFGMTYNELNP